MPQHSLPGLIASTVFGVGVAFALSPAFSPKIGWTAQADPPAPSTSVVVRVAASSPATKHAPDAIHRIAGADATALKDAQSQATSTGVESGLALREERAPQEASPKEPSLQVPQVSSDYADVQPGGDTSVYALLVNDRGMVLSVRMLVASRFDLMNLTYLAALNDITTTDIPPMLPGELRWIETKITFKAQKESLLP